MACGRQNSVPVFLLVSGLRGRLDAERGRQGFRLNTSTELAVRGMRNFNGPELGDTVRRSLAFPAKARTHGQA